VDSKRRRTGWDANADTYCYTDSYSDAYTDTDVDTQCDTDADSQRYTDSYTRRDAAAYADAQSSPYAATPADYSFPPITLKCQQLKPNDEKPF
jgi:hypothetical protein